MHYRWVKGLLTSSALIVAACGGNGPETTTDAPAEVTQTSPDPVATAETRDLSAISDVLAQEVEAGRRGGFVVGVVDSEGVVYEDAIGMADPYNNVPMRMDTDIRIASMTKPIISVGIMHLVDEGQLSLEDTLESLIPSFANEVVAEEMDPGEDGEYDGRAPDEDIKIKHLLSHTAGIGYAFAGQTQLDRDYIGVNPFSTTGTLGTRIDMIAALPLYEDPGTLWRYSYATDILGRVIEVVSGQDLQSYLDETIFTPLGMEETRFFLEADDLEDLAIVNAFDDTGMMVRSSGDALGPNVNDYPFTTTSGGAGLISTAEDYMAFCRMLLNGGSLNGETILKPETVKLMMSPYATEDMVPDDWTGQGFGLGGFVVTDAEASPEADANGDWGWFGYWDTSFIVSPEEDMAVILMAQTQPGPNVPPTTAWADVKAIAYGETDD